jgi:hypothetical protein
MPFSKDNKAFQQNWKVSRNEIFISESMPVLLERFFLKKDIQFFETCSFLQHFLLGQTIILNVTI